MENVEAFLPSNTQHVPQSHHQFLKLGGGIGIGIYGEE
jgi:hypothetical protein